MIFARLLMAAYVVGPFYHVLHHLLRLAHEAVREKPIQADAKEACDVKSQQHSDKQRVVKRLAPSKVTDEQISNTIQPCPKEICSLQILLELVKLLGELSVLLRVQTRCCSSDDPLPIQCLGMPLPSDLGHNLLRIAGPQNKGTDAAPLRKPRQNTESPANP